MVDYYFFNKLNDNKIKVTMPFHKYRPDNLIGQFNTSNKNDRSS